MYSLMTALFHRTSLRFTRPSRVATFGQRCAPWSSRMGFTHYVICAFVLFIFILSYLIIVSDVGFFVLIRWETWIWYDLRCVKCKRYFLSCGYNVRHNETVQNEWSMQASCSMITCPCAPYLLSRCQRNLQLWQDLYDMSAYILYMNQTIPEKWGGGKVYY